jgi:TonB family protein
VRHFLRRIDTVAPQEHLPVAQIRKLEYKQLSRNQRASGVIEKMKKLLSVTIAAAFLIALAEIPATTAQTKTAKFTAANIASTTDIPFPPNSIAVGVVTLSLSLDASGKIQNVEVQRDIPSLTSVLQSAVQTWTFTPANYKGSPIPSTLSVNAVFQPNQLTTAPNGGMALAPPQTPPTVDRYVPPQITAASFAAYPSNSVGQGTVILDVTIDKSGNVAGVRAVKRVASLTAPAIAAVKTWQFSAASDHNAPATGRLIVAFIFRQTLTQ